MPIRYKKINGTAYHLETLDMVCHILEDSRINYRRIRIKYGDPVTGLDWDDSDAGIVYRSGVLVELPRLSRNNGLGSPPILDNNIVKIFSRNGKILYKHSYYHTKLNSYDV